MAIFSIPNIKIAGIASAVPKEEYNNFDYELLSEKEKQTFVKMTGVEKRRVAPKGTTTSDLCEHAARKLLDELKWDADQIDALVFISQSRDYIIPATAGILQDKLGLSKNCMAYDISLGCSGYVYGLSTLGAQMSVAGLKKALLMVGDVSTQNTAYNDKSTFPLFGDAGTVTALEYDESAPLMSFNLQTDGSGYKAIIIEDGGIRNLVSESSFEEEEISEGIKRKKLDIALDGVEVFNFSLREVKPNILKLLEADGTEIEKIDYFVLHQANKLMNETIRKQLRMPVEKFPLSIQEFGNTSSASIPLTLNFSLQDKLRTEKVKLLLSGFGVGLSWGSVILETENIVCPDIIEI